MLRNFCCLVAWHGSQLTNLFFQPTLACKTNTTTQLSKATQKASENRKREAESEQQTTDVKCNDYSKTCKSTSSLSKMSSSSSNCRISSSSSSPSSNVGSTRRDTPVPRPRCFLLGGDSARRRLEEAAGNGDPTLVAL